MKFLADMGVSMTTVETLRGKKHDVIHLRERGLETLPDREILEKADQENRVILTFDLDFGDLLAAKARRLPSVIIFRLRNQTPASVTPKLEEVLTHCQGPLSEGAIVIVEDSHYRVRRLPV